MISLPRDISILVEILWRWTYDLVWRYLEWMFEANNAMLEGFLSFNTSSDGWHVNRPKVSSRDIETAIGYMEVVHYVSFLNNDVSEQWQHELRSCRIWFLLVSSQPTLYNTFIRNEVNTPSAITCNIPWVFKSGVEIGVTVFIKEINSDLF